MDGKKIADFVRYIHEKARKNIERRIQQYIQQANKGRRKIVFEPGDGVWLHLRKERFPEKRRSKLLPKGDGPFQIVEKINDSAYKLELPGDYNVSATFNASDLSPFDEFSYLRINPFQEGEDDIILKGLNNLEECSKAFVLQGKHGGDQAHKERAFGQALSGVQRPTPTSNENVLSLPNGPITRLKAMRFKEALQALIRVNVKDIQPNRAGCPKEKYVQVIQAQYEVP